MPYEYMIAIGKCQWGDLYIHDYTYVIFMFIMFIIVIMFITRQLLGEEEEEKDDHPTSSEIATRSSPDSSIVGEVEEEQGGQIIAFESKVLDYINRQHYHGLVRSLFEHLSFSLINFSWCRNNSKIQPLQHS